MPILFPLLEIGKAKTGTRAARRNVSAGRNIRFEIRMCPRIEIPRLSRSRTRFYMHGNSRPANCRTSPEPSPVSHFECVAIEVLLVFCWWAHICERRIIQPIFHDSVNRSRSTLVFHVSSRAMGPLRSSRARFEYSSSGTVRRSLFLAIFPRAHFSAFDSMRRAEFQEMQRARNSPDRWIASIYKW